MSALTVATEVLKQLEVLYPSTPEPAWSQLGSPVLTCTSSAVGVASSSALPLFPESSVCGGIENHVLVIAIARECAITFDQDGHTIPAKVEAVSAQMDADAEGIAAVISYYAQQERVLGLPSTTYMTEGGLAVVTSTVTLTES